MTSTLPPKAESLYLHIPFCDSLCPYCDFVKVRTGTFSSALYLERLIEEIEEEAIPDDSLKTLYLGGGTPSALSEDELSRLLSYLHSRFPSLTEATLEANPESLTPEKIRICKANGINRISLGVQSVNPRILEDLGRKHTPDMVRAVVDNLRREGIDNINLDFIYGLPRMTKADLQDDLDFCYDLNPTHLSFYSLQIEKGTRYYADHLQGDSEEDLRDTYDHIVGDLARHGYPRYEVSNFSKPGYESRHNLTYWHDDHYYAAGVSAAGYLGDERFVNTKSIARYLKGDKNKETEKILSDDKLTEFFMLNLRLVSGFSLFEFERRFHLNFLEHYKDQLAELKDDLTLTEGKVAIRPEKLYIMDSILLKLI